MTGNSDPRRTPRPSKRWARATANLEQTSRAIEEKSCSQRRARGIIGLDPVQLHKRPPQGQRDPATLIDEMRGLIRTGGGQPAENASGIGLRPHLGHDHVGREDNDHGLSAAFARPPAA